MSKRKAFSSLVCAVLALFLTELASAQSIWLDRNVDRVVWLEVLKPNFTEQYLGGNFLTPPLKTTFATAAIFLSARWRVSGLFLLRAEIPFASWGYESQTIVSLITTYNYPTGVLDTSYFSGFSENRFGNPLVGLQLGGPAFPLSGEFGIRFPLIQSEKMQKVGSNWAAPFGALADYNRFEAFLQDMWTLTAGANYQYEGPSGFFLRLRAGFAFLVPTKDYLENDLFVDYAPQVGYQFSRVGLQAGLSGRYLVSENSLDFGERTVHQLGFAANYKFERFIPGVHFRIPLDDDLKRDLDFVFGINVGYRLP